MITVLGIYLFFVLVLPVVIVIHWKSRPFLAFLFGAVFVFLGLIAPGIIQTFQAMMIYGTGDPQLMAGGISEALVGAFFGLPILLPLLALVQWVSRRRYKKSQQKSAEKTFH